MALATIEHALDVAFQERVEVARLVRAPTLLDDGDAARARPMLQDAFTAVANGIPPGGGEHAGTTEVAARAPGRGGLSGTDSPRLAIPAIAAIVGAQLT